MNTGVTLRAAVLFLMGSFPFLSCCLSVSLLNESRWTVLVRYQRAEQPGGVFAKLLEPGEVLDFGDLTAATIGGYGTVWGMVAPKPFDIFTHKPHDVVADDVQQVVVIIKGVKDRSMRAPFGTWVVAYEPGKDAYQLKPYENLLLQPRLVGVFPTVDRTCVLTPRFILGLPNQAIRKSDARDAERLLVQKWTRVKEVDPEKDAVILDLIDRSWRAYEKGLENVPLTVPVALREALGLSRQNRSLEND